EGAGQVGEREAEHPDRDQAAAAGPVGEHRHRRRQQPAQQQQRAKVGEAAEGGVEVGADRRQRQRQGGAVELAEEGGQPSEEEESPGAAAQSRRSRRSRYGPGPRKPQVAPMWASETPSSDGGPGSSQKARPRGIPARAGAATSAHAQPPSRW